MTPTTRLDVVAKLKDRAEERARRDLATARKATTAAETLAAEAHRATLVDGRIRGSAASFETIDLAQARALSKLKAARAQVAAAAKSEQLAVGRHHEAWRGAEAVHRAADARREELRVEERKVERRDSDEIASILFFRRSMTG